MKPVIVEQLRKSYGKGKTLQPALQGLSFEVKDGEIFGMIGPDGAGKTTLFRILTTLLLPDAGNARVNGLDVISDYEAIRRTVGYMPGKFSLYQDLTVEENLRFFATIFQTSIQENYDLIRDIYDQIAPFKDRRAGQLSGGMKQKLALSCALIHRPSVLFLDEPTTGVDAVSRREFWDMLQGLQKQGISILVSTPYMDEASRCNRVGLLQNGALLAMDTPAAIVSAFGKPIWGVRTKNMMQLLKELQQMPGVKRAYPSGMYHHVLLQEGHTAEEQASLLSNQFTDLEWKEISPGIEDCFIDLMQ